MNTATLAMRNSISDRVESMDALISDGVRLGVLSAEDEAGLRSVLDQDRATLAAIDAGRTVAISYDEPFPSDGARHAAR